MVYVIERWEKLVIPGEAIIGYTIAALLLVPAAVILSLYPINWILGTVSFYTASISLGSYRLLFIAPVLVGLALAWRRKDWFLTAMLVPGIALLLYVPDDLGAYRPSDNSRTFHPEQYSATDVAARVGVIERSINEEGWLSRIFPPSIPSIDSIKSLQIGADKSVAAWRDRVSIDRQKSGIQQQIDQANQRKAALGPQPPVVFYNFQRFVVWRNSVDAVNNEIATLTGQINKLNAGAASGDLYPAAVSATASLKVVIDGVERLVAEKSSFIRALHYILAASVSLAIFLFVVGFTNWAMAGLVIGTALSCLWSAWPIALDDWPTELSLILYPAFVCAASAFVLRFGFRGYLDNALLLEQFERRHVTRSLVRATIIWLPFPAIVVCVVLFNNLVYSYVSSAIYCEGSAKPFCGSLASEPPILDSDPTRDTLRDDVNAAIYRLLARFEAEAIRGAEGARTGVAAQVDAAKNQVVSAFDRILPGNLYEIFPDLTPPPKCRWLLPDIKCFARKIALERLNEAYQAPRNRFRARVVQTLNDVGTKITTGVMSAAGGFQDAIKGEFERASHYATATVDATFVWLNVFSVVQMALMLVVSIRSLLLIFGRMLYRGGPDVSKRRRGLSAEFPGFSITHSEARASRTRPTVKAYRDEFELRGDEHLPLLTKRHHNVDDADQATVLFRARYTSWPFRRFASSCLILTEVTRQERKKSIRFSTIGGRQLVVWEVPPGAQVFFRWDRFVAMSATMKIKKSISLRVGGLAMGTTMHASAVGPGLLIQESLGQVELTHEESTPGSVFPSRLLSWETNARVRIKSPKSLTSVYIDPPSLELEARDRAVSDSGGDRRRGLGVLRELMRLFRP